MLTQIFSETDLNTHDPSGLMVADMVVRQLRLTEIGGGSSSRIRSPTDSNPLHPPKQTCSIEGCELRQRTMGLCASHYAKEYRERRRKKEGRLCACGCGELVYPHKKYLEGHDVRRIFLDKDELRLLCESPKTIPEIAKCLNISISSLVVHMKKLNIKSTRHKKKRTIRGGYVYVISPDTGKTVNEHGFVMSKMIGRPLRMNERVHHIDMDKTNNCEENLWLYEGASIHTKAHHSLGKLVKPLMERDIIDFDRLNGKYILKQGYSK